MALRVLVTAAASGIGLSMAQAFAASGARVFVCDIDEGALRSAAVQVAGLETAVCDVGDRKATEAMVAEAVRRLGGLDVLVNNAGISGPNKPMHELDPSDWDAVLRVNLTGIFDVTRHAIPHLMRSGKGVVINMSSVAGRFGYPNRSPYAATKWAVIGLTKTLAMELGKHNVRVNAIAPGGVVGERIQRVLQGRAEAEGKTVEQIKQAAMVNQSLKQMVDPDDIGALAVFLASDAAKSISGQVFPVDGDMQRT